MANSAVWNDDAVHGALDSAAFWVKDLPFIKSLSGYWKFLLAPSPNKVPENFYDSGFQDFDWGTLPGKHIYHFFSIFYFPECKCRYVFTCKLHVLIAATCHYVLLLFCILDQLVINT